MPPEPELLGLSEVADLLRTSRQAVTNWRQRRSDFPEPLAELKSGPIWDRDAISNWAAESGLDTIADAGVEDEEDEPQRAGVTIAVMNMKGGVGKSTLTANLGWYAAYRRDQRVLLVDLDPQFNLSQYVLGTAKYEEHLENERLTVLDIFEQASPPDPSGKRKKRLEPADVIANVREWHDGSRLDLVPSSLQLSFTLKNPASKEQLLKHFLDEVRSAYDLILIDCAPTESILTMAAYSACNAVLIPVKPEFLSTIGLPLVVNSLDEFKSLYKKEVDVLGIVFNASAPKLEDQRSRSFVRQIAKQHSWPVFRNAVSQSDSYPKGSRFGTPIFLTNHARTSKIEDFEAVAEEFFERLETIG